MQSSSASSGRATWLRPGAVTSPPLSRANPSFSPSSSAGSSRRSRTCASPRMRTSGMTPSGGRARAAGGPAGGAALAAITLHDALAAVAVELGVEALDRLEHLVGDLLVALPRRARLHGERQRLAEEDRDLGELEALPVA